MGGFKNDEQAKVVRLADRVKLNFVQRLSYWWNLLNFKFANTLSKKEQNLSLQKRKIYFFIFFGALFLLCLYFLANGVTGLYSAYNNQKSDNSINLSFGNIQSVPVHENTQTGFNTREKRVLHFIAYLDSLKSTPSGRIKYESINKARPGLMDSIRLIKMNISNQ